jgi:DNA-binding NarL/FixJ family response regulator
MTNQAIAKHLSLSTRTVENHIKQVLQKLSINTRSELPAALARGQQ